jgi:GTP-binding protein Era
MEDSAAPAALGTRAGFVALVGRPNAGKSTLLNALVGEHLAAVGPKEQTTRHRIPGILTEDAAQIVFLDTPGLLDPGYPLQEAMLATALAALEGVDATYFLVDNDAPGAREGAVLNRLKRDGAVLFLVLTKADLASEDALAARASRWHELAEWQGTFRVSAVTGQGIDDLVAATRERLPEQPFFYPPDEITDLTLRFVAAEHIREACYEELGEEVPYSVHVGVDAWKEPSRPGDKTVIEATIYVERQSQKGIVIGEGGKKLKAIGMRARRTIEELLGGPVFLSLWVKVRKKWTRREPDLRWFGYK